ncbi:hypothetical protein VUR80DRAFT_229 [Thermomyces stellatus]
MGCSEPTGFGILSKVVILLSFSDSCRSFTHLRGLAPVEYIQPKEVLHDPVSFRALWRLITQGATGTVEKKP